ncbi:MAG: hypothetical protein U1E89_21990 [Burkholderiaceae bacterium]
MSWPLRRGVRLGDRARSLLTLLGGAAVAMTVLAQGIQIQTPQLPERRAAAPASVAPRAVAAAMVAAMPSAAGGTCRVQATPDRGTLSLLGPDGLARRHVPLGDFRSQRVVHSGDGLWAVVLTKLRGEAQFAATVLDLTRCEALHTQDLPRAGEDVRFERGAVIVQLAGGEQRVPLADAMVR